MWWPLQGWPKVKVCIIQITLEHWQAYGINHLFTTPILVFDHPHSKDFFLNIQFEPPWHCLVPFLCILALVSGEKRSTLPIPLPLLRKLYRMMRSLLNFLFSKLDKPSVFSLSSQDMPFFFFFFFDFKLFSENFT